MHLSPDGHGIILAPGKCYTVSFSINLCDADRCGKDVAISVRTLEAGRSTERFCCHYPANCADTPFTATGGGIVVSTHCQCCRSELVVMLVSPDFVKVLQGSICVIEI